MNDNGKCWKLEAVKCSTDTLSTKVHKKRVEDVSGFDGSMVIERGCNRGFTLIELMIVVVVIGILAGLAIPRFGAATTAAKQHEAHMLLKQIHTLQAGYYERYGAFAPNTAALAAVGFAAPANLQYYAQPQITATASAYISCMNALYPEIGNRSINQDGTVGSC